MLVKDWNFENEVISSDEESYDSDKIDSDVEAELYSVIHHQQETSFHYQKETSLINSEESSLSLNSSGYEERSTQNSNYEKAKKLKANTSDDNLEDFNVIQIDESFTSDRISNCKLFQSFESPIKNSSITYQNKQNTENHNSLKRKSDLISNVLENIQSNCKNQKKSKHKTSTLIEKTKKVKLNNSVTLDSSDEDSDIIWLDDNETKNRFETNLSQHSIYLNSDSDSTDSWCNKFSSENLHNLKQKKNSKDLWYINDEDLYRYRKSSGRYHERLLSTCTNCKQKGHTPRYCPFSKILKCFICGNQHKPSKCKKRTCIGCYKMGHDVRFCPRNIATCSLCNMIGHSSEECPDLWRRYHLSTSKNLVKSVKYFQDTPLYCYNCGQAGHFGGECMRNRMITGSYPTWPTVIDCKLPKSTRQEFRKKIKKTPSNCYKENSFENKPESFMDNFLARSSRKNKKKKKKVKKTSLPSAEQTDDNVQQTDFQRTPKAKQKLQGKEPNSKNLLALAEKRAKKRKEKKLRRMLAKQNP